MGDCDIDDPAGDLASKLKAIGHPVRIQLLSKIYLGQEICVGDLHGCLKIPQPVVSQHLAILKKLDIVEAHIQGNKRIYSIKDTLVSSIIADHVKESSVSE